MVLAKGLKNFMDQNLLANEKVLLEDELKKINIVDKREEKKEVDRTSHEKRYMDNDYG